MQKTTPTNKEQGANNVGGKLPKNNTIAVATLKSSANYETWATKQGGGHKSWKKRYFLLVPTPNNPKTADLYYFKNDKAKSAIGVIKITERSCVKDQQLKGKGPCIAIESGFIGTRTYLMHCSSPADNDKFKKALNDKIASLKIPKNTNPTPDPSPNPSGDTQAVTKTVKPTEGIKFALESAKNAIPFLGTDSEDRILEFWQIWTESIPVAPEVSVTLVMTTDLTQLSWRVYGPQNVLIQEMVDFFWNVGAPEQEIDRLNDVGGLINPLTIGSWIDMSTKGGMDGGWVFPVTVPMLDALKACDEGSPLTKLSNWTKDHHIEECITVGRDMGASPPRQTEIRFAITGDNFDARLNLAMNAYKAFSFPAIPDSFIAVLRQWNPPTMHLSVITSSDGFVRIGMILPDPDKNIVTQLCNIQGTNPQGILAFQQKMKIERPAYVEFQFLMESFGYGVYNEGLNVVFHYNLDPHMG